VSQAIIENVTLVDVNPKTGSQKYTWGDSVVNVIYLSGWHQASNVKVGDRGKLVYHATPSSGRYYFVKEEIHEKLSSVS